MKDWYQVFIWLDLLGFTWFMMSGSSFFDGSLILLIVVTLGYFLYVGYREMQLRNIIELFERKKYAEVIDRYGGIYF